MAEAPWDKHANPHRLPPGKFGDSKGKRVSQETYEGIWEAWKKGMRTKRALMVAFNVNHSTITRLVDRGYPNRGWKSIRKRWEEYEEEQHVEQQRLMIAQQAAMQDKWDEAKKENLGLLRAAKVATARMVKAMVEACERITFTRTKRYKNKAGDWVEEEVPLQGGALAAAMLRMAQAIDILQTKEAFWLGGPTEVKELRGGPFARWMELTPEQLAFIEEHGQLPEGVTEEDLLGPAFVRALTPAGGARGDGDSN